MFTGELPPTLAGMPGFDNDKIMENVIGCAWYGVTVCFVIWWNKNGYTGTTDENGKEVLGCIQAQVSSVQGHSQEDDCVQCAQWGRHFPLDIAIQIIDRHGGWLKPDKIAWRPKTETNSPLKLKLKNKTGST